MKKFSSLLLATILLCSTLLTACSTNNTVDFKECTTITINGANGYGTADVTIDLKALETQAMKGNEDVKTAMLVANFESSLSVAVSPNGSLSNGDEITIDISYSKDAAKEAKVSVKNTTFTYRIDGLGEGTPIDPFAGLSITFDGVSPFCGINTVTGFKNSSTDPVYKHISYKTENNPAYDYKLGETFTVIATLDAAYATKEGLFLYPATKEFTVENTDQYIMDKTYITSEVLTHVEGIALQNMYLSDSTKFTIGEPFKSDIKMQISAGIPPKLVKTYFLFLEDTKDFSGYNLSKTPANYLFYIYEVEVMPSAENPNTTKIHWGIWADNVILRQDGSIDLGQIENRAEFTEEELYSQIINPISDIYTIEVIS